MAAIIEMTPLLPRPRPLNLAVSSSERAYLEGGEALKTLVNDERGGIVQQQPCPRRRDRSALHCVRGAVFRGASCPLSDSGENEVRSHNGEDKHHENWK